MMMDPPPAFALTSAPTGQRGAPGTVWVGPEYLVELTFADPGEFLGVSCDFPDRLVPEEVRWPRVVGFLGEGGPCERSGIARGFCFTSINHRTVRTIFDIGQALIPVRAGKQNRVWVRVRKLDTVNYPLDPDESLRGAGGSDEQVLDEAFAGLREQWVQCQSPRSWSSRLCLPPDPAERLDEAATSDLWVRESAQRRGVRDATAAGLRLVAAAKREDAERLRISQDALCRAAAMHCRLRTAMLMSKEPAARDYIEWKFRRSSRDLEQVFGLFSRGAREAADADVLRRAAEAEQRCADESRRRAEEARLRASAERGRGEAEARRATMERRAAESAELAAKAEQTAGRLRQEVLEKDRLLAEMSERLEGRKLRSRSAHASGSLDAPTPLSGVLASPCTGSGQVRCVPRRPQPGASSAPTAARRLVFEDDTDEHDSRRAARRTRPLWDVDVLGILSAAADRARPVATAVCCWGAELWERCADSALCATGVTPRHVAGRLQTAAEVVAPYAQTAASGAQAAAASAAHCAKHGLAAAQNEASVTATVERCPVFGSCSTAASSLDARCLAYVTQTEPRSGVDGLFTATVGLSTRAAACCIGMWEAPPVADREQLHVDPPAPPHNSME